MIGTEFWAGLLGLSNQGLYGYNAGFGISTLTKPARPLHKCGFVSLRFRWSISKLRLFMLWPRPWELSSSLMSALGIAPCVTMHVP
ncbi:hypothetical protein ACS0TY_016299 [Phlomoides rotata]